MSLRDRVTVIAGGEKGIGRATVECFKLEGAMLGNKGVIRRTIIMVKNTIRILASSSKG